MTGACPLIPGVPVWLGGVCAAIALAAFLFVAFPQIPLGRRRSLSLDPSGIQVVDGCARFRLDWDNLRRVHLHEGPGGPVLGLQIADIERVLASVSPVGKGGDHEQARDRARMLLFRYGGQPFPEYSLHPEFYGLDARYLCLALGRYVQDPTCRRELELLGRPGSQE